MPGDWKPILVVVAHPDDETIGTAVQLARWDPSRVTLVHVTDGCPRHIDDAADHGFKTFDDYVHERRRELYAALDVVGIRPDQCMLFKYHDQEAHLNLVELTQRLRALMLELQPGSIYTHPYEGGHPDHDSTAFAVAQAAAKCPIMEFTSYHAGPNGLVTGEFLNGGETETLEPTPEELEEKRKMFACFHSQQKVLSMFEPGREKFRPAPAYDFSQPPHPGRLHYESLGWDITGEQWRAQAAEALELLNKQRDV